MSEDGGGRTIGRIGDFPSPEWGNLRPRRSGAGQGPGLDAPLDRRRPAGHAELGADALEMGLHRLGRDVEEGGEIGGTLALRHAPDTGDLSGRYGSGPPSA